MNWYRDESEQPERKKPRKPPTYGEHHRLVLRALRSGPLTDEAIFDRIVRNKGQVIRASGARTRRQELTEHFGYVQKVGTGRSEAGRRASLWGLTESGRAQAQAEFEAAKQFRLDLERTA